MKFYTGLPSFNVLMAVFRFVSSQLTKKRSFVLSNFEEFIATIMKLRLGLFEQDIAYRFVIHRSTMSRIFRRWIDIMFIMLKPLIKWPGIEKNYAKQCH